jgi:hypothetical protein
MTYAIAIYGQPAQPGEYVPEPGSAYLVKTANKAEAVQWVKKNSELIARVIGDAPIVYTNNRGKVIK